MQYIVKMSLFLFFLNTMILTMLLILLSKKQNIIYLHFKDLPTILLNDILSLYRYVIEIQKYKVIEIIS